MLTVSLLSWTTPTADAAAPEAVAPLAAATVVGEGAGDGSITRVSTAGDVDGDGFDDLLVGTPNAAGGDGRAYLVSGPISGRVDLSTATARLLGTGDPLAAGDVVAGGGDLDGDGFDDLVVSATSNGCCASSLGQTYVLRGPVTGDVDLAAADVVLDGESDYDFAGYSLAIVGDVNGDALDDLVIGAPGVGGSYTGAAYLLLGPVRHADLSLADARVTSPVLAPVGYSIARAGDTDGDGLADVLLGAPYYHSGRKRVGGAALLRGPIQGEVDVATADLLLVGAVRDGLAGSYLAGGGDVDGDGADDVLVGDWWGSNFVGLTYVVSGSRSGVVSLASADATLTGELFNDQAAQPAVVGDLDGDGVDDVVVGAPGSDVAGASAGAASLLYGPLSGAISLANADRMFVGQPVDGLAASSAAADLDADGVPDLLLSAGGSDLGGIDAGATYVLAGASL